MRALQALSASASLVSLASEAIALALPPVSYGLVPDWWAGPGGAMPEFDLEVWANAAVSLTGAVLYGATLHPISFGDVTVATATNGTETLNAAAHGLFTGDGPVLLRNRAALVYADKAFTSTAATDTFTAAAHGLLQGDGPLRASSTVTLPAGLTAGVDYWVIYVDANNFKLAESLLDADDGEAVAISDDGAGVHTLADTASTTRDASDPPLGLSETTEYYVIKTGAGTLQLAATLADAMSGTPVEFSDDGTGTNLIQRTDDTERVFWQTHDGLLGLLGDGAIALTGQVGYRKRVPHSPRVFAYSLVAALSTSDPEWVSASIVPVVDVA